METQHSILPLASLMNPMVRGFFGWSSLLLGDDVRGTWTDAMETFPFACFGLFRKISSKNSRDNFISRDIFIGTSVDVYGTGYLISMKCYITTKHNFVVVHFAILSNYLRYLKFIVNGIRFILIVLK